MASLALFVMMAFAAALPAVARAPDKPTSILHVVARISGPDGRWDYATFDPARHRVLIAHGDTVMAIDASSGAVSPAFAKGDQLHAIVVVPGKGRFVTTNSGDDTARVIDAASGALLARIPASRDSDAAIFDPFSGDVVVVGGDSGEITLVDPEAMKAVGKISVGVALEYAQSDGRGRLFVNAVNNSQIMVVDLRRRAVAARWPLPGCRTPTGLALVEGERLISACANGVAVILNSRTGRALATLKIGAGPDAAIVDRRRGLALIPCGRAGTLAVIALRGPNANTVVDTVPTQLGARTGAVDPATGRVWLPTAQYIAPPPGQRYAIKPGTFQVLVVDR